MHRGRHDSSNSIRKISQYFYFDISCSIQPCCQRLLLCLVIINPLNALFRLDIRYLIKYQPPQTDDTAEEQKRKFNRCEKKLIVGLIVVQFVFVLLGAANAIINRILDEDDDSFQHETFSYLFEAAIYFIVMIIAIVISSLLIRTVITERSSLWPKVKDEVIFEVD